jgi:hypothetical protein
LTFSTAPYPARYGSSPERAGADTSPLWPTSGDQLRHRCRFYERTFARRALLESSAEEKIGRKYQLLSRLVPLMDTKLWAGRSTVRSRRRVPLAASGRGPCRAVDLRPPRSHKREPLFCPGCLAELVDLPQPRDPSRSLRPLQVPSVQDDQAPATPHELYHWPCRSSLSGAELRCIRVPRFCSLLPDFPGREPLYPVSRP